MYFYVDPFWLGVAVGVSATVVTIVTVGIIKMKKK